MVGYRILREVFEKECQIVLTTEYAYGIINSVATETSTPIHTTLKHLKKF